MPLLEILYVLASLLLALYGLNSLYLVWLRLGSRREPSLRLRRNGLASDRRIRSLPPGGTSGDVPRSKLAYSPVITIQLPIYNELHTVARLLDAVRALEYPQDRLQVQVLDDSTDQTKGLIQAIVARRRAEGKNWVHLHRARRTGYKAGALSAGLEQAEGEYVAIFDADFVPAPDFLRCMLPWFADPRVGCVQGSWTHLNRNYSTLTQLQALGIDGHFWIEQVARSRSGYFLNFNGSAGIWRRECILDAGGWQTDTLTEDLDLSYRAQMRGWRIQYVPEVAVPAELPAQMSAYKIQQARWAQGSLQTARKLMFRLLRSRLPLHVKLEGALHLTTYLVHPLILMVLFLALPLGWARSSVLNFAPLFMIAVIGPPLLYLGTGAPGGPNLRERFKLAPGLVILGIGLSLSNSRACLSGLLLSSRGRFERTPKFAVRHANDRWERSRYVVRLDRWVWAELLVGLFAAVNVVLAAAADYWASVPWLLVYAASFVYVGGLTLWQTTQLRAMGNRVSE